MTMDSAATISSSAAFLADARHEFRRLKNLTDRALSQIDDAGFFAISGPESNSVAIIVKHLAGNMISRWTDFLTTDGEKPNRERDSEFIIDEEERGRLMERWEEGWGVLFGTLEGLRPDDLERTITIRGEGQSAQQAIVRQISHYAYHVGQIVLLAKELRGSEWTSLSIPRGKSKEFAQNPTHYRS